MDRGAAEHRAAAVDAVRRLAAAFNALLFIFGFVVLALQPLLPFAPAGKGMLAPTTIFNTAISFFTNTNLQHYAGEQHLSYTSQLLFVVTNMFLSAGVGFCALCAVIRGLRGDADMGNYYVDLWRATAYVFFPSSLVMGVVLDGARRADDARAHNRRADGRSRRDGARDQRCGEAPKHFPRPGRRGDSDQALGD